MANVPLSYSSLLAQADRHHADFQRGADARDAEMYGPGRIMRTVMRPITQRLPPQWDAFMQALQNNGVRRMRQMPHDQHDTISGLGVASNQIGVRNTFQAPEGMPGALSGLESAVGARTRSLGPTNSTAQSRLKVQGQRGGAYAGSGR